MMDTRAYPPLTERPGKFGIALIVAMCLPASFIFAEDLDATSDEPAALDERGSAGAEEAIPTADEFLIKLRSGEVLRAASRNAEDQTFTLKASFGATELKLEQVNQLTYIEEVEKYRAVLKNGSQISGTLEDKAITILTVSGEKKPLAWNTISSIERLAPDLELLAALKAIGDLEFVNKLAVDETKFPEARLVLAESVKRDHALRKKANANEGRMPPHPPLLKDTEKVELVRVFDPTKAPMRKHAGKPEKMQGAFAPKALVGTTGGIMLWGPYTQLEKGRYIAIYRIQYLQKPNGGNVSYFDVCHRANTWKGTRPNADEVKGAGEWNEIPVPFETPETKAFEFRLWPNNRKIAQDRIYLFKLE